MRNAKVCHFCDVLPISHQSGYNYALASYTSYLEIPQLPLVLFLFFWLQNLYVETSELKQNVTCHSFSEQNHSEVTSFEVNPSCCAAKRSTRKAEGKDGEEQVPPAAGRALGGCWLRADRWRAPRAHLRGAMGACHLSLLASPFQ